MRSGMQRPGSKQHYCEAISAEEQRKLKVKHSLKCQTEVEAKIHVEEQKAPEIKNNVLIGEEFTGSSTTPSGHFDWEKVNEVRKHA